MGRILSQPVKEPHAARTGQNNSGEVVGQDRLAKSQDDCAVPENRLPTIELLLASGQEPLLQVGLGAERAGRSAFGEDSPVLMVMDFTDQGRQRLSGSRRLLIQTLPCRGRSRHDPREIRRRR